jgi:ABC-2 type transport system permease protein
MYIQNAMRSEIELQKIGGFLVDELSRMNLITAQELTDSLRTQLVEMASKIKYSLQANVAIKTIDLSNGAEKKTSAVVSTTIGLFLGILIYMFIFMYGTQIMRGVIEEKNNRIVEVIISSVRPFQLMIGKITGIALVGLTQFLLWIVLTFSIVMVAQVVLPDKMNITKSEQFSAPQQMHLKQTGQTMSPQDTEKADNTQMINEVLQTLRQIDFVFLLLMFIFYFIGGYLLYGAMFAAIGAAVDNETDTQQFMLPITIPLVFAIIMSQFILNNPGGPVAKWLSIIPFTSPVIMMIRLPFYSVPPYWDVLYSALALIAGFIFTTWFAGKIYRTGILMYGKKPTYKELWRWMRYKA